jgi:hypothetical protein
VSKRGSLKRTSPHQISWVIQDSYCHPLNHLQSRHFGNNGFAGCLYRRPRFARASSNPSEECTPGTWLLAARVKFRSASIAPPRPGKWTTRPTIPIPTYCVVCLRVYYPYNLANDSKVAAQLSLEKDTPLENQIDRLPATGSAAALRCGQPNCHSPERRSGQAGDPAFLARDVHRTRRLDSAGYRRLSVAGFTRIGAGQKCVRTARLWTGADSEPTHPECTSVSGTLDPRGLRWKRAPKLPVPACCAIEGLDPGPGRNRKFSPAGNHRSATVAWQ